MQVESGYEMKMCILSLEQYKQVIQHLSTNTGLDEIKLLHIPKDYFSNRELKKIANSIRQSINTRSEFNTNTNTETIKTIQEIHQAHSFSIPFTTELVDGILIATTGNGSFASSIYADKNEVSKAVERAETLISRSVNLSVVIDSDAKTFLSTRIRSADTASLDETLSIEPPEPKQSRSERIDEILSSIDTSNLKSIFVSLDEFTNKLMDVFSGSSTDVTQADFLKCIESQSNLLQKAKESYIESTEEHEAKIQALNTKIESARVNNDNLVMQSNLELNSLQEELKRQKNEANDLMRRISTAPDMQTFELLKSKVELLETERAKNLEQQTALENKLSSSKNQVVALETSERKLKDELNSLSSKLNEVKQKAMKVKHKMEISRVKSEPFSFDDSDISEDEHFVSAHTINTMDMSKAEEPNDDAKETLRRAYIYKPSTFGLTIWNPSTSDISSYMERVLKACKEAKEIGAQEHQLIRLIMRSLPDRFEFVEGFVDKDKKSDHTEFAKEVVRILGAKTQRQMHDFITAQRKPGESILSYFSRILMLYKSSNNLTDDTWQSEKAHTSAIYTKIYDACYNSQKSELIRLADSDLEKGTLDIIKLKELLISVSKLADDKINAEVIQEVNVIKGQNQQKDPKKKDTRKCWFCEKPGHIKRQCWKLQKLQKEEKMDGTNREPKDSKDGRQAK